MAQQTPGLQEQHAKLAPLSSRYIDVPALPWKPTRFPGIEIKVLMEDPDTGLQTVLTRMAPGTVLTEHMHVQIEQRAQAVRYHLEPSMNRQANY